MRPAVLPLLAVAVALAGACRRGGQDRAGGAPPPPRLVRELTVPAAPGSGGPIGEHRHRLMLAHRVPDGEWTAPQRVAEGAGWFVNWADFPSVAVLPDGTLFAQWLENNGPAGHGYGVRVVVSRDDGRTWSAPVVPHRDGTDTEHGFVSLVPWPDPPAAAMGVVWLDGRSPSAMRLMATTLDAQARLGPEVTLDDRVCDCCQTAAARVGTDVLVAYRDRSAGELRDISVLTRASAGWTPPHTVGGDGWEIHGCPVNGPAVSARARNVAVAWFSAKDDPHTFVALSPATP